MSSNKVSRIEDVKNLYNAGTQSGNSVKFRKITKNYKIKLRKIINGRFLADLT